MVEAQVTTHTVHETILKHTSQYNIIPFVSRLFCCLIGLTSSALVCSTVWHLS